MDLPEGKGARRKDATTTHGWIQLKPYTTKLRYAKV